MVRTWSSIATTFLLRSTAALAQVDADGCMFRGCGGRFQPTLSCQCNSKCTDFGNCCSDYNLVCLTGSVAGCQLLGCGKYYAASICQCNAKCQFYDNCCSDFDELCLAVKSRLDYIQILIPCAIFCASGWACCIITYRRAKERSRSFGRAVLQCNEDNESNQAVAFLVIDSMNQVLSWWFLIHCWNIRSSWSVHALGTFTVGCSAASVGIAFIVYIASMIATLGCAMGADSKKYPALRQLRTLTIMVSDLLMLVCILFVELADKEPDLGDNGKVFKALNGIWTILSLLQSLCFLCCAAHEEIGSALLSSSSSDSDSDSSSYRR
eukprot:TRINITY_DN61939_c0_g1_i1.p1 TRINITY_DN61939_c0_g1~~TRINITY_DN61939_c0_g1_i1.p1  ORF type:complete len:334 (+),score=39.97 TRINITY_DN61939_c0_g1_i1:34-1002(+)